ncbi:MAG: ATP-dependent DNA helicase RecG [Planctomycetes bacterium]|nr:ATP-dependent DNA helicase RecG [Planctomycetota bacterium]
MSRAQRTHPSEPRAPASLTDLPGVGPARARALASLGIRSPRDLVLCVPSALRESAVQMSVASALASPGSQARVRGKVERVALQRFRGRSTVRVRLSDASGSILALYFNQPWMAKSFTVGEELEHAGRVSSARVPVLVSPRIGRSDKPLAGDGELSLHYPDAAGLGSKFIGKLARAVLPRLAHLLEDSLTPPERARLDVDELAGSAARLHAPASLEEFVRARRRVRLENLLELQAGLLARSREARAQAAPLARVSETQHAELLGVFPFGFTAGQAAVALELRDDLASGRPMRRLLQGDVGCGKTALGLYAALIVARSGGQTAFLAPTEILAEQHYQGLKDWLARAKLHAVLLTGSLKTGERRQVLAQIESGMADVVFGTHSLFSADVRYRGLQLAVIDEQQRFGVAQRQALIDKGTSAHVLLMTATPIPRTLALSLYGDLDTSLLRERPAGRGSLRTRWVRSESERAKVAKFLDERLAREERVFWVTPRIGEGEEAEDALESGRASAEAAFERLRRTDLARHGLEIVHGRMSAAERAARLERFQRGAAKLLVATTVIEVGVDVPEATVLVVESAERMGLAQLHQLRGRVGRGPVDSWCLLFGDALAKARFEVLERTHDGFEIAEQDLAQRGMGDLGGVRQAGLGAGGTIEPEQELALLLAARELFASRPELYERYRELARAATP